MPMSVSDVLSASTGPASDRAVDGCSQYAHASGCSPRSWRNLAPHNANALVIPHAPPDTISTPAPSTASTTAPTTGGQEPRSTRVEPWAVGTGATGGGRRRACTARLTSTTTPSAAIVTAHEPNQPMCCESTNAGSAGRAATSGNAVV